MVAIAHDDTIDIDQAVRLAFAGQKAIAEFHALPAESQLEHGDAFWAAMLQARVAIECAFIVLSAETRGRVEMLTESYRWN